MSDARDTPGRPQPERGAAADAGPDWDRVPFELSCGRCGADLRGRSEPTCPDCQLTFEWDDVVPLEDLHCAQCGYQLLGLTQPRCPECGTSFRWSDPLEAARSRRNRLFEHWRRQPPVRSLLRTWWLAAFRPRRLWAEFSIHDPPKVGPLVVFMLLQWIVFAYGWPAAAALADPAMNGLAGWLAAPQPQDEPPGAGPGGPPSDADSQVLGFPDLSDAAADSASASLGPADSDGRGYQDSAGLGEDDSGEAEDADPEGLADVGTGGSDAPASADGPPTLDQAAGRRVQGPVRVRTRFVYPWRLGSNDLTFLAVWYVTAFGSFQLFVLTKRRHRIRWQQILRVYVHATAFAALCTALWCVLEAVVDTTWLITTPPRPLMNRIYLGLMQGMFVLGVVVTWLYLWIGFSRYLKLRYAWAAAPACLLLGNRLAAGVMYCWPIWLRWPSWLRLPL